MKIAIIEPTGIDLAAYHDSLPEHEIVAFDSRGWSDEQLISTLQDAEIIALSNRPLSAQVIQSLPHLKFISVAFAGIDHVDPKIVAERKIPIQNAAGYANTAVAELVIGFMISLARNIPQNNILIRKNGITNTGTELKNKILGIIGYGEIGKEIERLALAFRMQTLIYDSRSSVSKLQHLFSQADYVSLHIPLNESTRNFVTLDLLKRMKPTAYLINCARGPIVNSADLKSALESKILAGAALDVFDMEPPLAQDYSLLNNPHIIATPHIGFNTQEALLNKGQLALNNIINFLKRE